MFLFHPLQSNVANQVFSMLFVRLLYKYSISMCYQVTHL